MKVTWCLTEFWTRIKSNGLGLNVSDKNEVEFLFLPAVAELRQKAPVTLVSGMQTDARSQSVAGRNESVVATLPHRSTQSITEQRSMENNFNRFI